MNFTITYLSFLAISIIHRIHRVIKTYRSKREKGRICVKPIYSIMFGFYLLILIGTVTEYFICNRKINLFISGVGFFLYVSVIPIRNWAISSLGKYMSEHIEIRDSHRLVRNGTYRHLRHPLLLCLLLEVIGISLIPNSYYSLIIVLIFYFPLVFIRMYLEEKALIENLGQEYLDYKKEVYALLPFKKNILRRNINED